LQTERAELARQLRAAYTSGRQERVKLALNQQSPAELGRMMTYYRYLGDARIANINSLRRGLETLAALRAEAQTERDTLTRLAGEADTLIATLARGREERKRLIASMDRKLQQQTALLAELAQQEQDLNNLLSELSSILSDYPISAEEPISQLRGKLTWPVSGTLVTSFGQARGVSKVRSKGVVLATAAGSEVRSIYHGRIAYADWLPGLGLLVIIDHGDGLLSLYGYNETLQKSVGDWISPGEVIATVGNSGGQAQPALYFELRRGKEAVNPRPWFRNRPGPDQR
ncbi:MAG: peptidoglycan DD-metalloendopeptidase family protein, partial [Coleofasciculaceae cyanobacterium]